MSPVVVSARSPMVKDMLKLTLAPQACTVMIVVIRTSVNYIRSVSCFG